MKLTVDLRKPVMTLATTKVEIIPELGAGVLVDPGYIKAIRLMRTSGMSRTDILRAVESLTGREAMVCKIMVDAEPVVVFWP